MPPDRHAVIRGVDDVGIVQFTHLLEFLQDATDLYVYILAAGELTAELVPYGTFVPLLPNTFHPHFVTHRGMAVIEGMLRQPVDRQGRLIGIGRRQVLLVEVIDRPILRQQSGLAVTHVVRMRKAVVNEERVLVLGCLALLQVIHDLLSVPMAALFVGAPAAGAVVAHSEELVGCFVAVTVLAGPHGIVAGPVEDSRQSVLGQVGRHLLRIGHVRVHDASRLVRNVPNRTARHHHVARGGAHSAHPGPHVMCPVQHHTFLGQAIDVGRVENGARIIDLEIQRGLVVHYDEQKIGLFGGPCAGKQQGRQEESQ